MSGVHLVVQADEWAGPALISEAVTPDFQYVSDPGGRHPDAVVVGVRLQFAL